MVMPSNDVKRDTLGRVFKSQQSPQLNDAHLSGERDSIRSGIAHRFDDRKGAQLLNDKNFGRHDAAPQAPLDGMRFRRGDGLKVAADLFPLNDMNPVHRAELISLFRNPAVARAYTVNPDATTHIIAERRPELKGILEVNAPFSVKEGVFSVNTNSPMYRLVATAEQVGAAPNATRLHRDLDRLHTSARGTALGGAAGIETITHTFLTACARHGFQSEQAAHVASRVQRFMHTDRARADLQIVASLAPQVPPAVQVSTVTISQPLPLYVPHHVQSAPQLSLEGERVPQAQLTVPPSLPAYPSAQNTMQPEPTSVTSPVAPPIPPSISAPQPEVQKSSPPVEVAPPPVPQQPSALKEGGGMMKQPEPTPVLTVSMTPTMQRLVDVVNNSTLERQIGSPRNNPILEFSDKDHDMLKKMLTNPITKQELLGYSDEQIKVGFKAVRPDRIAYLEEWLAMNHRDAVRHPGLARSMAGITPQDTNRIGQVVGIARSVAHEREQ